MKYNKNNSVGKEECQRSVVNRVRHIIFYTCECGRHVWVGFSLFDGRVLSNAEEGREQE